MIPLIRALKRVRASVQTEAQLQALVEGILAEVGIAYEREARLPGGRPDFLLGDGTAVELKIQGPSSKLIRQVAGYASSPRVSSVLVVTTQARHAVPAELEGKPVRLVRIGGRLA